MKDGQYRNTSVRLEVAEALAIDVLGFLAAEPVRLSRFLDLSGLSADNLRTAAASARFLPAILDYLASDERLLIEFAADSGHDPASIANARNAMR